MEHCEADHARIRPGRFEQMIRHPKHSLPSRALCFHQIIDIQPVGTPLDVFIQNWYSSFHASARILGHNASGWQAWTIVGHHKLSVAHVAANLGFTQHPALETGVSIEFFDDLNLIHVEQCPTRDALAVYCMDECDEVRCRPSSRDETSSQYYKCLHGVEYLREECRRMDDAHRDDFENADETSASGASKVKDLKRSKKRYGTPGLQWRNRIRFLTVEGQSNYVNRIEETCSAMFEKICKLAPLESADFCWRTNVSSCILLDQTDLDRMLTYWDPVPVKDTASKRKMKVGCDNQTFTYTQWILKLQYQPLPGAQSINNDGSARLCVGKFLAGSVLTSLKEHIAASS